MSGLCKGALQPHAKGAVRLIFDKLGRKMGTYDFQVLFDTIRTDRGSEFGDPDAQRSKRWNRYLKSATA